MTLVSMPAYSHGGKFKKNPGQKVIHSAETDITDGIAEALAGPGWFGGAKAGTSAHAIFDSYGPGVRMVAPDTVAYHVGPDGNPVSKGYEHAGRASFTRAQWTTAKGLTMLRSSAAEVARECVEDGTPPRWLSVVQVAKGEPGLCTHNDVRLALGGTTHSDPGPNFPFDLYLQFVQEEIDRLTGKAPAAPAPLLPEDDMSFLAKIPSKPEVWLCNGMFRRHIRDENQLEATKVALSAQGLSIAVRPVDFIDDGLGVDIATLINPS